MSLFSSFCVICFVLSLHGVFRVLSVGVCGFLQFMSSWPRDEVVAQKYFSSEMEPTQAQAHQRNRFSGRITARSKKAPFSPRFQGAFLFGSGALFSLDELFPAPFARDQMSLQRSAIWQTICPVLVFTVTSSLFLGLWAFFILSVLSALCWTTLRLSPKFSYPCGRRHPRSL